MRSPRSPRTQSRSQKETHNGFSCVSALGGSESSWWINSANIALVFLTSSAVSALTLLDEVETTGWSASGRCGPKMAGAAQIPVAPEPGGYFFIAVNTLT